MRVSVCANMCKRVCVWVWTCECDAEHFFEGKERHIFRGRRRRLGSCKGAYPTTHPYATKASGPSFLLIFPRQMCLCVSYMCVCVRVSLLRCQAVQTPVSSVVFSLTTVDEEIRSGGNNYKYVSLNSWKCNSDTSIELSTN